MNNKSNKIVIIITLIVCVAFIALNKPNQSSQDALVNYEIISDRQLLSDSEIFLYKYRNVWGGTSGPGSAKHNTIQYRKLLQKIFDDDRFQSFVDFGCGDFQIMKLIQVPANKSYRGIDAVEYVIENNRKLYGVRHPNYEFNQIKDLRLLKRGSDLLRGDMLIVKDVLIHFSNEDVAYFIDNILSNFKYSLITNDYTDDDNRNADIPTGKFRPIDLTYPPFNLKHMHLLLNYTNDNRIVKRVYLHTNLS